MNELRDAIRTALIEAMKRNHTWHSDELSDAVLTALRHTLQQHPELLEELLPSEANKVYLAGSDLHRYIADITASGITSHPTLETPE